MDPEPNSTRRSDVHELGRGEQIGVYSFGDPRALYILDNHLNNAAASGARCFWPYDQASCYEFQSAGMRQLIQPAIRLYYSQMSKPIEEMVAVLWEAMLRQIEAKVEERIDAAISTIPKGTDLGPGPAKPQGVRQNRPAEYFISLKDVSEMTGLGRSTIYSLEKSGTFPKKIHVTPHSVRYRVGAIREWMQSLENQAKAKKDSEPEILTDRQRQRLMRLALARVPKPPPKALPYYTMADVMRLAGANASQIYDGVRDGSLPKWEKTGWPAQQWDRGVVDAWIEARKAKK